jgi:flagellar basal-body rod protein FlgB
VDTQPWIDQNNVELDQEVAKMTENAMLYQAGVTLLSTKIRMFKSALNTRG